ncbi:MAG: molecular chaperone TorD family protein [Pseudomonadota bacterium]
MQAEATILAISAEEKMRADLYSLLGKILFFAPTQKTIEALKGLSGDETEIGEAFNTLAKMAEKSSLQDIKDEFSGLFVGMGRGELLPYGSYYLTGFLNEKPLAKLRNSMSALGIGREESVKEPEDHIGRLFEMMAGLIAGQYGQPAELSTQRDFFSAHIEPWAGHFFADLEAAKLSRFYQPVGTIGRLFTEIETSAFSMK